MAERIEKVFQHVRQELSRDPGLGSRELYEIAKKVDGSVGSDSLQQFHARYVLPLKRELSGRTGRGGTAKGRRGVKPVRAPKAAAAPARAARGATHSPTKTVSDRDRARSVLLRFAQDFAVAETKTEIVAVMSRLEDYVDELSPRGE